MAWQELPNNTALDTWEEPGEGWYWDLYAMNDEGEAVGDIASGGPFPTEEEALADYRGSVA